MESFGAFFHMGGYAVFVWPAFGITALIMLVLFLMSRHRLRANEAALERLEGSRPRRRPRGAPTPEPDPKVAAGDA